ncbi:hypothetical protein VCUG_01703 [Vavraia culicis subsp. floridensis]|uniref:UmuC domain-containing protein n=1 Tax=Vavraia culicis (isolate floridensis) TaxID=948595 RepID=L2GU30_VAVCU|nr:uncharacterized protein VCUG_01703 [Vavraia culicis subsp. floridensis]ELA46803.1 hypothetical protein VCUG_01703 [Vavraia culicis subsp. floridensis]
MVHDFVDNEDDIGNYMKKVSGSQLTTGNIVYCDDGNAFDTKKEENIKSIRMKAHAMKERIAHFEDNELRYAHRMVHQEKERLKKDWPALFCSGHALERVFVYVDIDAFYASVEVLVDPVSGPLAVGGMSMLAAVNYAARKYGIRSGMPGYQARTLCPSLVIRKCNFERYNMYSERVMGMLARFDGNIEIYGLDECVLVIDEEKMRKGYEYFCEWKGGIECILNDCEGCSSSGIDTTSLSQKHDNNPQSMSEIGGSCKRRDEGTKVESEGVNSKVMVNNDLFCEVQMNKLAENDYFAVEAEGKAANPENEFVLATHAQREEYSKKKGLNVQSGRDNIILEDGIAEHGLYEAEMNITNRKFAPTHGNDNSSSYDTFVAAEVSSSSICTSQPHPHMCSKHKKIVKTLPFTFKNVERLVTAIRMHARKHIGLTISAGISVCRGLSKLCSTINKPNDQFSLSSGAEKFLSPMKITKITGIGPKTSILLENGMGISTIRELHAHMHILYLVLKRKSFHNLFRMSHGLSHFDGPSADSITIHRQPHIDIMARPPSVLSNQSVSKSRTFNPTNDYKMLMDVLWSLCKNLGRKLTGSQAAVVTITVKTEHFRTIVRRQRGVLRNDIQILDACSVLLNEAVSTLCASVSDDVTSCYSCSNRTTRPRIFQHNLRLRLLGVSLSKFSRKSPFFKRRKMSMDVKRCIECKKVFVNVSEAFFYSHVNTCLDWKEQKNKNSLLRFFNTTKKV